MQFQFQLALNHATEIPPFLYPEVVIELLDIKKDKAVYTKNLQQIIDEDEVTFGPGLVSVKIEYLDEWLAWGGRILIFAKIHEKNVMNSPLKIRIKGVNENFQDFSMNQNDVSQMFKNLSISQNEITRTGKKIDDLDKSELKAMGYLDQTTMLYVDVESNKSKNALLANKNVSFNPHTTVQ